MARKIEDIIYLSFFQLIGFEQQHCPRSSDRAGLCVYLWNFNSIASGAAS
jgi:hypothetical protein